VLSRAEVEHETRPTSGRDKKATSYSRWL